MTRYPLRTAGIHSIRDHGRVLWPQWERYISPSRKQKLSYLLSLPKTHWRSLCFLAPSLGSSALEASVPKGGTILSGDATRACWILIYGCCQNFRPPVSWEQLARRVHHSPWDTDTIQQEAECCFHTMREWSVWTSNDPLGCLLMLSCATVSTNRQK